MTYITSPSYTERLLADNDDSDVTCDARIILKNFTDVMFGGPTLTTAPPAHLILPHNQHSDKTRRNDVT